MIGFEGLPNPADLQNPRARAILSAIDRNNSFTLVALCRRPANGGQPALECLIVDVECHEVPGRNPFGIRVPERLALCVPADRAELVEAVPLRDDFPALMHLNSRLQIPPYSLCLYFERPVSVARNWTAESFLNRICWWLIQSAKGLLHPADQPAEQIFFNSGYELILPWNFHELKANPDTRFIITRGPPRDRPGSTFMLFAAGFDEQDPKGEADFFEIDLPAVVHGFVERNPNTLSDLDEILHKHDIDLKAALVQKIRERVPEITGAAKSQSQFTILALNIPVRRAEGLPPEALARRAFLLMDNWQTLGIDLGSLFEHQDSYFNFTPLAGTPAPEETWRERILIPMDVLLQNDRATSLKQSGIEDQGPTGVLIGTGSLGSALLDFWVRSGWGLWSVVDNDHIKPHNLARHNAFAMDIGLEKAKVAVKHSFAATMGASPVTAMVADATAFSNQELVASLTSAGLVVDASTTLEYPRAASEQPDFARHVSVFVTPNGNDGVLLAEDARRELRLSAIEAQYYRAVIDSEWGKDHLDGNLGTFWSGASCRDISLVLPYSRVAGHAANFAEMLRDIANGDGPRISIWKRDSGSGSVAHFEVPVWSYRTFTPAGVTIVLDDGVAGDMRAIRSSALPNETGGVLVGYFDFNVDTLFIVAALPPPPDSVSTPTSFVRGTEGLEECLDEIARRTANIVTYIGEWHSHPTGHSARPSGEDVVQLTTLAVKMAEEGLSAVQIIVAEHEIRVLHGSVQAQ